MQKETIKKAFLKSIPILCSYVFVSMAYGITMEEAGFAWYQSLLISLVVYTGAFQFVLVSFLSGGTSIITIAVTAFLMNSRQTFYSLTFVDEFKKMGKRLLYMIHTMTDETYAVNLSLTEPGKEKEDMMFVIAFLSRCYWMAGTIAGGVLGQLIPIKLEGIDFCMTALFVIIFIDNWEKTKNHAPAVLGLIISMLCLIIAGERSFMLPSLILVSGVLLLMREKEAQS